MGFIAQTMSELENGYGDSVVGTIGATVVILVLTVVSAVIGLCMLVVKPFIILAKRRKTRQVQDPSSYDRRRIRD